MAVTAVRGALVLVLVGSLGLAKVGSQSPTYFVRAVTIYELGTLGGRDAAALDINELGEIVGWSTAPDGRQRAFLYRDGRMRDLTAGLAGHTSVASSINARSEIVGWAVREADGDSRGFYSAGGTPVMFLPDRLDPRPPAYCLWESQPTSIADSGHIVGLVWISSTREEPPIECTGIRAIVQWRWPTAPVERILASGGYDAAVSDVNSHGDAVGWHQVWSDRQNGARWRGGVTTIVPSPASSATVVWDGSDYDHAYANGINDRGYVAGGHGGRRLLKGVVWQSFVAATLWSGTSPHAVNLGTLPTGRVAYANDVNEQNFAVGYSDSTRVVGSGTVQANDAFLWHKHFGMVALPRLWPGIASSHCEAFALNDFFHGSSNEEGWVEVVGRCYSGGVTRAVRWDVRLGVR